MGKLMAYPKQKEPEDIWQRRATAAGILAVRELINGGTAFPPATPVGRLDDIEIGWLIAAGIFGWIKCRSEQAIAEGWNIEATIQVTGLDPIRGTPAWSRASCPSSASSMALTGIGRSVPGRKR